MLFRLAFGLLAVGYTISLAPALFAFYSDDGILPAQPNYSGTLAWGLLGWFPSDAAVLLFYFLLLIGAIALLVGLQTRIAALVFFVCLISFGRRNPWVLNSGDLLRPGARVLHAVHAGRPGCLGRPLAEGPEGPLGFSRPSDLAASTRAGTGQHPLHRCGLGEGSRSHLERRHSCLDAFRIEDIARFPDPVS